MKLAHVVVVTPHRSGLYETTRELVAYERRRGVDAYMVDPRPTKFHPGVGSTDRGAPVRDMTGLDEADVIVSHSGVDGLKIGDRPIIHVQHGRPKHSWNAERHDGRPVLSYQYRWARDSRSKAVVTFWMNHIDYLKVLWGDVPVEHVPAPVDTEFWKPGPSGYDWHGKGGNPNIVIADPWRDDVDPFECLNAFAVFCREFRDAKLHIYGCEANRRGLDVYLKILRDNGNLGEVLGWVKGLEHIYRAADLVITANIIDTRTVREAKACGCKVVRLFNESLEDMACRMARELNSMHDTTLDVCCASVSAANMLRVLEKHAGLTVGS